MAAVVVVLTPLTVAALVFVANLVWRRAMPEPSTYVFSVSFWTITVWVLAGVSVAVLGWRRTRIRNRLRPVVSDGVEQSGEVVEIRLGAEVRRGVEFSSETITVACADGSKVVAFIEEPQGTPLPSSWRGAAALVWSLDGRVVVSACGALFESQLSSGSATPP